MVGVVGHNVAFRRHSLDNVRGRFHHVPHYKKRRRGVVFFQRIQNFLRTAVFIAAVKGQIDHLLRGVPHIAGIILCQLLRGGVAHRRLALHREGESPVI